MIENKVKEILEDSLGLKPDSYKLEDHFEADLGLDSLDLFDVIIRCEKEFNIVISEDTITKGARIQDLIDYIEKKVEG